MVGTAEKFISSYMSIAAIIMIEQSREAWAAICPAVLEQCKTLAPALSVLASHLAWPQDKEGAAECAAVKSALPFIGSALGLMETCHQVVDGNAKELPSSASIIMFTLLPFAAP